MIIDESSPYPLLYLLTTFLLLFSLFILLRCHFHLICPFFFHLRELLFIGIRKNVSFINVILFAAGAKLEKGPAFLKGIGFIAV